MKKARSLLGAKIENCGKDCKGVFMKRFAFFVLVFTVLGFSVYGQSPARVYIVSSFTDVATETACYWVDGTRVVLPDGTRVERIAVENGIVYAAGSFINSNGNEQPCYWVNGVKHDINSSSVNITGIAVTDGKVYVTGYTRFTRSFYMREVYSYLWVDGVQSNIGERTFVVGITISDGIAYFLYNDSEYSSYTVYGQTQSLGRGAGPTRITVIDGRVYVSGSYYRSSDPNACYFVDGTRVDLQPSNANNRSYASDIAVANGNVYVSGRYLTGSYNADDSLNTYIACYWANGTKTDLNGVSTSGIAVANGNVYVIGRYKQGDIEIPCYWVDGVRRALPAARSVSHIIAVTE